MGYKPAKPTLRRSGSASLAKRPKSPALARRSGATPRDRGSLRLAREHILSKIAAGELQAGMTLAELPVAGELGVSRTPVREAIGQLVAEGILQKTSRGVSVAEPTRRDIVELYELREAIEVFVIGKIASRGLESHEMEALEALLAQMQEAAAELKDSGKPTLKGEVLRRFSSSDLRFHVRLIQAGGNERMLKVLDSTNLLLRIFTLRREHHTPKLLNEVCKFHRHILDAVKSGDAKEAMRLLTEHIRLSRDERLAEYAELHEGRTGW